MKTGTVISNKIGFLGLLNTIEGSKVYYALQGALEPYAKNFRGTAEDDTRASSTLPPEFNELCRGLAIVHLVEDFEEVLNEERLEYLNSFLEINYKESLGATLKVMSVYNKHILYKNIYTVEEVSKW